MAWSIFDQGGGDDVALGWAKELLTAIGAPRTPGNLQFVYDWEKSEGSGGQYNPLNQGPVPNQPGLTSTGSQYGGGAADYVSWKAGIQGAAAYLDMPDFSGIRDALRSNDPASARSALFASPWAQSHYAGGRDFSSDAVPGGRAVLPAAGVGSGLDAGGGAGLGLFSLPSQVTGFFSDLDQMIRAAMWLASPSNWVRVIAGVLGFVFLGAGLIVMGRAA